MSKILFDSNGSGIIYVVGLGFYVPAEKHDEIMIKWQAAQTENEALKAERDALAADNRRLSEKLIAINLYCQKNNIGEWGASASEALIAQCDALAARNHELVGLILRMRDRWWPFVHGSVCPSDTAYNLRKESADILCKSPQQCLRDIQAEAGRAGWLACLEKAENYFDTYYAGVLTEADADEYAESLRKGTK